MNKKKTKSLVLLSLFIAIEVVMVSIPFLGFIPIGPLRATTLHIPVIIAGLTLGKEKGSFVGLVFGIMSLIMNTISPTITSFVFSPFISGNLLSIVVALVPRILIGYVSGLISELGKHNQVSMIIGSFLGSMTNTILVLSMIYLFFGHDYASAIGQSINGLLPYLFGIISTNGIVEAIVGTIIAFITSKAILKIYK